jgi:hypothetical protein
MSYPYYDCQKPPIRWECKPNRQQSHFYKVYYWRDASRDLFGPGNVYTHLFHINGKDKDFYDELYLWKMKAEEDIKDQIHFLVVIKS